MLHVQEPQTGRVDCRLLDGGRVALELMGCQAENVPDYAEVEAADLGWLAAQLREIHETAADRPNRVDPDLGLPIPYEEVSHGLLSLAVYGDRSVDVCVDGEDSALGLIELLRDELLIVAAQLEALAPVQVAS